MIRTKQTLVNCDNCDKTLVMTGESYLTIPEVIRAMGHESWLAYSVTRQDKDNRRQQTTMYTFCCNACRVAFVEANNVKDKTNA